MSSIGGITDGQQQQGGLWQSTEQGQFLGRPALEGRSKPIHRLEGAFVA
jgi:hypothetical protein